MPIHPVSGSLGGERSQSQAAFHREKLVLRHQGVRRFRVQENKACVSEPPDQGSIKLLAFTQTARCLPNLRYFGRSDSPESSAGSLPRFLVKPPNFAAVAKKKILPALGPLPTLTDARAEMDTPGALAPSKQISTQGCRPGYADYFLISASASPVDLVYCCRSNKTNIQRPE